MRRGRKRRSSGAGGEYKYENEVGAGRCVVRSTSEFSAREHEKDDGGMMTRFGVGAAGCFGLRPMSGVGFVTLSVFVCEGDSAYFCLLL